MAGERTSEKEESRFHRHGGRLAGLLQAYAVIVRIGGLRPVPRLIFEKFTKPSYSA